MTKFFPLDSPLVAISAARAVVALEQKTTARESGNFRYVVKARSSK